MQSRIDRYDVRGELGRGGMAVVYHAFDSDLHREVAIKVLPRELAHDRSFRRRFKREAQILFTLDHPAVSPILDYGETFGQPFLVMPYLTGGTLAERIKRGLLVEEIADILDSIAGALDSAHAHGIIHRDVKPSNILFDADGKPHLGDFGLVRMLEGTSDITGSGAVGTPAYMAPEMSQAGQLSHKVDIYSLAATLFEMLTGEPPFEGDTPMGTMVAHITQPVPDVVELRSNLPPGVATVIERGLAKNPHHRYASAGEMARDFRDALAGKMPVPVMAPKDSDTMPIDRPWLENLRGLMTGRMGASRPGAGRKARGTLDWRILALTGVAALVVVVVLIGLLNPKAEGSGGSLLATSSQSTQVPATPATPDSIAPTPAAAFPGGGGEFMAFVSNRDGDDDIWLLSFDDFEQINLTANEGIKDTSPAWSPDGTRIAFVSNRDNGFEIYVMERDGSHVIRLTDLPGDDLYPAWSPDGTQIVFASDRDGGDLDLFVMDADGSNIRQLTHNAYHDLAPAWSPDGTLIAYSTYEDGNADLALVTAGGTPRGRLIPNANEDLAPAWSPDSQWIAFASNREAGSWDIYVVQPDGSGLRALTASPDYDNEPFWSPDGQWIAFASGAYPFQRLVMLGLDDSGLAELIIPGQFYYDLPAWQPQAVISDQ